MQGRRRIRRRPDTYVETTSTPAITPSGPLSAKSRDNINDSTEMPIERFVLADTNELTIGTTRITDIKELPNLVDYRTHIFTGIGTYHKPGFDSALCRFKLAQDTLGSQWLTKNSARLAHLATSMPALTEYDYLMRYHSWIKQDNRHILIHTFPADVTDAKKVPIITLVDLAKAYNYAVPAEHIGWIFNRILEFNCLQLKHFCAGTRVHNFLNAYSICINRATHRLCLDDWQFCQTYNSRKRVKNMPTADYIAYASYNGAYGATVSCDIANAAKLLRWLIGEPITKAHQDIRQFLDSCMAGANRNEPQGVDWLVQVRSRWVALLHRHFRNTFYAVSEDTAPTFMS